MNKLVLGTLTLALFVPVATASAGPATTGPAITAVLRITDATFQNAVYWDRTAVTGARSTLLRQASGVEMSLKTLELASDHAVTAWWFVFNHPESCSHGTELGQCGPGDLAPFGGDASVESSLVYASGHRVGESGRATFAAMLAANDAADAVFGPGLTNPFGAEIHLGLRDHGPGDVPARIGGFGDCHPDCVFVQFSAFPA
jgi:hypothetical protein